MCFACFYRLILTLSRLLHPGNAWHNLSLSLSWLLLRTQATECKLDKP